jgi:hypothetical protein
VPTYPAEFTPAPRYCPAERHRQGRSLRQSRPALLWVRCGPSFIKPPFSYPLLSCRELFCGHRPLLPVACCAAERDVFGSIAPPSAYGH